MADGAAVFRECQGRYMADDGRIGKLQGCGWQEGSSEHLQLRWVLTRGSDCLQGLLVIHC